MYLFIKSQQSIMNTALVDKPNIEIYGHISFPRLFKWTRIILFESLAAGIYTYGVMCSYYTTDAQNNLVANPGHSSFMSLILFLCLVLAGQLTGGHTDPIITLALLLMKGSKINFISATIYIISQFCGSFAGAAIAYGTVQEYSTPQPFIGFTVVQSFGGELVGSFLLCLWLLIIVNDHTTFIRANFWNYMLLPVIFFITREVTSQINGLNPASVLANQVFYGVKYENWQPLKSYWAFIIGPLIGTIISVIFFNFFYLPLLLRWKAKK